jgi:hypothetical protein
MFDDKFKERFFAKVEKTPTCWIWKGAHKAKGYGTIGVGKKSMGNRKNAYAHRISWEMANGEKIPDGLFACHKCDNPPCVNPEHIFIGTNSENILDSVAKKRFPIASRHYRARLKDSDVQVIFEMRKSGLKHREIAEKYGVCRELITHVLNRQAYKSIEVAA